MVNLFCNGGDSSIVVLAYIMLELPYIVLLVDPPRLTGFSPLPLSIPPSLDELFRGPEWKLVLVPNPP